jgi:ubiquinone/menaquinone biosynthesis C-methylase UbiE
MAGILLAAQVSASATQEPNNHEEHAHKEPTAEHQHRHEVDPERAEELAKINAEYDAAWAAWQEQFVNSADFAPGLTVADLGAGKGELTVLLARRVGNQGQVFANEI